MSTTRRNAYNWTSSLGAVWRIGFLMCCLAISLTAFGADLRELQHGIDFVPLNDGTYQLIWSSSGRPPTGADSHGDWTHDVYHSRVDPVNPRIRPSTLISRPEAQEPASSAITVDGHIMVTMEDGWNTDNTVAQRYGVFDSDMAPVKPYPHDVLDGGHSGHVASVNNRFVVFYSDEWVDGGGVDDLGSGDDVLVSVYDSNGRFERNAPVAVGPATRDWWPLVAGSDNHALLLWQRFVAGRTDSNLMYSIYDPETGGFVRGATQLATETKYYAYDVQYISSLASFLVVAAGVDGSGSAWLVNDEGDQTAVLSNLPSLVRESQPAILAEGGIVRVVYPKKNGGVMVLAVGENGLTFSETIGGKRWGTAGTDGIFIDSSQAYFVSLSASGLLESKYQIAPLAVPRDANRDVRLRGKD